MAGDRIYFFPNIGEEAVICPEDADYKIVKSGITMAETPPRRIQGVTIEMVGFHEATEEERGKTVDAFKGYGLEIIDGTGSTRTIVPYSTQEQLDNPHTLVPEWAQTFICHTLLVCSKDDVPILGMHGIKIRPVYYYP